MCESMNVEFTDAGVSEQWLDGRRTESRERPCKKAYCHNEVAQQEGATLCKLHMTLGMYMSLNSFDVGAARALCRPVPRARGHRYRWDSRREAPREKMVCDGQFWVVQCQVALDAYMQDMHITAAMAQPCEAIAKQPVKEETVTTTKRKNDRSL